MDKKRTLNFEVSDRQALLIDKVQAKRFMETECKSYKRDIIAEIFQRGCEIIARENGLDWSPFSNDTPPKPPL